LYLCMEFGVRAIAPEHGAAVMVIQATSAVSEAGEVHSADYLMGWSALLAFQEAVPKVLRRLEQRTRSSPHKNNKR
jgi:hypothetical protein